MVLKFRQSKPTASFMTLALCLTCLYLFATSNTVDSQDKGPATLSLVQFDEAIRKVASKAQSAVVSLEVHHKLVEGEQVFTHSLSLSGTIWDDKGRIITLGHGLGGAAEILVQPHSPNAGTTEDDSKEPIKAELVGIDEASGLALLKANFRGSAFALPHPPKDLKASFGPGSLALCVGNPFGLNGSVRIANVSGVQRSIDHGYLTVDNVIQMTAPVNPGDPGGLIADARGYLRGIMMSSLRDGGGSQSQQAISYLLKKLKTGKDSEIREALQSELQRRSMLFSAQNIGFAVPVTEIAKAVNRIENQTKKPNVWLGVRVTELPQSWREHFSKSGQLNTTAGIMVIGVVAQSPAHKAGIKRHDILVDWNGKEVDSPQTLQSLVLECKPSQNVTIKVIRGNQKLSYTVSIAKR